jgi:hypothetical protein
MLFHQPVVFWKPSSFVYVLKFAIVVFQKSDRHPFHLPRIRSGFPSWLKSVHDAAQTSPAFSSSGATAAGDISKLPSYHFSILCFWQASDNVAVLTFRQQTGRESPSLS